MKEIPILMSGPMVRAILEHRKSQTRRPVKLPKALPEEVFEKDHIPAGHFVINQWRGSFYVVHWEYDHAESIPLKCPYSIGDRLWVRETWRVGAWNHHTQQMCVDFRADGYCDTTLRYVPSDEQFERLWAQSSDDAERDGLIYGEDDEYHWTAGQSPTRWRPSIHMPRWASRFTLEVTGVRAERVQEISETDAVMEGWPGGPAARLCALKVSGGTISGQAAINWFAALWDSIYANRGYSWDSNQYVWVTEFEVVQ